MRPATDRLQRRYRQLLRCYPPAWRRRYEDEMVAVLLDEAEANGRESVTLATALDLVGHAAEERLESLLRWLPRRLRDQVAVVALVAAAGLSLVMMVAEMIGAHYRPTAEEILDYSPYLRSGPFLTIGIGLYLADLTAALLVVLGRGGLARVLVLAGVGYAAALRWPLFSAGFPAPRAPVLVLLAGLGVLAALGTIRPSRRAALGIAGYGAGFLVVVAVGVLLTKPALGWSIGTMATSGNVALAALATALPFVGAAAILISALVSRRHRGWPAALALAAVPVVLFCTLVSQSVNPAQAAPRAAIPLCYVLVVAAVALTHRRRHRRLAGG